MDAQQMSNPGLREPLLCNDHVTSNTKATSNDFRVTIDPSRPWRGKGHRKLLRLGYVFLFYCVGMVLIAGVSVRMDGGQGQIMDDASLVVDADHAMRYKRDVEMVTKDGLLLSDTDSLRENPENCTPRSVHNFPGNFFTFDQTRDGGVVIHILIALYMFAALAVVCDDYFVPALEHICEDLGLQADVAGATFMAAGSSAPEFMTSVVGVFFAESDVGVGTIVGSAVFNILFIIGVCGIFAGMVVELTWYPLVRDTCFYLLSVLTLFLIIKDQSVTWYEALLMILLYMVYIVLMYFNRFMESASDRWIRRLASRFERQPLVEKPQEHVIPDEMKRARAHRHPLLFEAIEMSHKGYSQFENETEPSRISQASLTLSLSREYDKQNHPETLPEEQETVIRENNESEATGSEKSSRNNELMTVSEFTSMWTIPESWPLRVVFVLLCPLKALFYVTIPDSRRPGIWARLYLLSFVISVAWISALTYIMVWMVTIIGDAMDIPDTVMGLTLLAAGTSVPDCLASIFVARDGYGDMAVSNSLGSNVFDILLCLGIPWLIESAIHNGDTVSITSGGLTYSSLTLLATVAFLLVSMGVNKWKLTRGYGVLCLFAYALVVVLSCLYELNVFGHMNPPACPR